MKRVLLTGSGGFVGARVMAQLAGRLELIPAPRGLMARAAEADITRLVAETCPRCHPAHGGIVRYRLL